MTAPIRIQRSRAKGWRMPPNTIYVGRPGRFGNPFPWRGEWIVWAAVAAGFRADAAGRKAACVAFYRQWLNGEQATGPEVRDQTGGTIKYENGIVLSLGDAACNIAAGVAKMIASSSLQVPNPPLLAEIVDELRGKNLACWCAAGQPCHADVLLELANR